MTDHQQPRTSPPQIPENYDVVIVGGGASGLSAALVLGRARRRVAVIDSGSPRNAPAPHMQGFLSRDGIPPVEFLSIARSEVISYGVAIIEDKVVDVTLGFTIGLAEAGFFEARRILIATGARDELPDIPGVSERWGRDLLHCPYCHGWEVRDQALGVFATHPGAVPHALLVRQWSNDLVFFSNNQTLTDGDRAALEARRIGIIDGEVGRLVIENDRLTGVELTDGRNIARSAVFIRTVNRPNSADLLRHLGCDVDDDGFVAVDGNGRTSVLGVWAAGNVVDPRAQVITSAGSGSAAAIAINADLVQEEVALAEQRHTATANTASVR